MWNIGWLDQDAWFAFVIFDDGGIGQGGRVEASLGAIEAAPGEAATGGCDGDGVVGAAGDVGDFIVVGEGQRWYDDSSGDDSAVIACGFGYASLAKGVQAKGIGFFVYADAEGVVLAAADEADLLAQAQLVGNQSVGAGTDDDAVAELILLAGAPDVDVAFGVEGEGVVGATDDIGDFLYVNERRSILDNGGIGEADDAIVALIAMSVFWFEKENVQLTRNVPQPYTWPSSVSARERLSPAATFTKTVPSGKDSLGIAVGVLSRGFSPLSLPSSEPESDLLPSISFIPPSQAVSLPNAP